MHAIHFRPATEESDGVREENAVWGQEVGVGGLREEVFVPDGAYKGEEDALG